MKVSATQLEVLRRLYRGDRINHMEYMGWFRPIPYWFFSSDHKKVQERTMYRLRELELVADEKLTEKGIEYVKKVKP